MNFLFVNYLFGQRVSQRISVRDDRGEYSYKSSDSFSSYEINKILGCHSNEIKKILGYISKSEVVHKDDMVKI